MQKQSAGVVVYRYRNGELQVLLVHPGGPFYQKKDDGVWSIPKGEYNSDEDPLQVAKREFYEETGNRLPEGQYAALTPVKIKSGKVIKTWAIEADFDTPFIESNLFEMEWPPKSGKNQSFQEVDRADWFDRDMALKKLNNGQHPILIELIKSLSGQ